jgi:hypothetical protein
MHNHKDTMTHFKRSLQSFIFISFFLLYFICCGLKSLDPGGCMDPSMLSRHLSSLDQMNHVQEPSAIVMACESDVGTTHSSYLRSDYQHDRIPQNVYPPPIEKLPRAER